MEKRKMTKTWFVLGMGLIVALGFMAVKAAEGEMAKPDEMTKPGKECTMMDMQICVMKCMMNCDKNTKDLSVAMASLDAAVKAIDAGNMADAKMEIEKAKLAVIEGELVSDIERAKAKLTVRSREIEYDLLKKQMEQFKEKKTK